MLGGRAAPRFPRADYPAGEWRVPLSGPASKSDQGKDLIEHLEERRPAPWNDRRGSVAPPSCVSPQRSEVVVRFVGLLRTARFPEGVLAERQDWDDTIQSLGGRQREHPASTGGGARSRTRSNPRDDLVYARCRTSERRAVSPRMGPAAQALRPAMVTSAMPEVSLRATWRMRSSLRTRTSGSFQRSVCLRPSWSVTMQASWRLRRLGSWIG